MERDAREASNVINLMGRRGDISGDCFARVEAHWQTICSGRLMPRRSELDPRAMAEALDRTFLIERVAPGVARFRIAGAHLNDLMGMDVRGMPLTAMTLPSSRDTMAEVLEAVFCEPARVDLALEGRGGLRRGRIAARMLLLPMRDGAGDVTRALGCLAASHIPTRTPWRFDVVGQERRTLIGYGELPEPEVASHRDPATTEGATARRATGPLGNFLRLVPCD